jgi:hypothetical protein
MTAALIAAIIGREGDDDAVQYLVAVDAVGDRLLHSRNGITINQHSDHYKQMEGLAEQVNGKFVNRCEADLHRFPEVKDRKGDRLLLASDCAGDRWIPVVDAAYYVGLSIGLRLAGGGR